VAFSIHGSQGSCLSIAPWLADRASTVYWASRRAAAFRLGRMCWHFLQELSPSAMTVDVPPKPDYAAPKIDAGREWDLKKQYREKQSVEGGEHRYRQPRLQCHSPLWSEDPHRRLKNCGQEDDLVGYPGVRRSQN
jgi:hypothetical protein